MIHAVLVVVGEGSAGLARRDDKGLEAWTENPPSELVAVARAAALLTVICMGGKPPDTAAR